MCFTITRFIYKGQRVAFTHFNCWFLCRADMKKEACMTIFMTTSTLYSLILKYAAYFIMMLHTCRWNNPGILKPNVTKHHANPSCNIQKIGISTCYRFTAFNSPKQDCSHSLSFYFPSSSLYAFSMLFTTLFLQLNIISQRKGQLIFEMWKKILCWRFQTLSLSFSKPTTKTQWCVEGPQRDKVLVS